MAYEIPGFTRSYEAVADLSSSNLKFVKLNGATVAAVSAAADGGVGVLQNKPLRPGTVSSGSSTGLGLGPSNNAATVMIDGVTRVKTSKAIAAGVPLYLTADGSVTDVKTGVLGKCVGISETSASGANKIISMLLKPLGAVGDIA